MFKELSNFSFSLFHFRPIVYLDFPLFFCIFLFINKKLFFGLVFVDSRSLAIIILRIIKTFFRQVVKLTRERKEERLENRENHENGRKTSFSLVEDLKRIRRNTLILGHR